MTHFIVYFRDARRPKDVYATKYVPEGGAYVFYNPSGYGFAVFQMYEVARVEVAK